MEEKVYIFRIKRFNPQSGPESYFQDFEIVLSEYERVLDGLLKIQSELDPSLAFRRSCAHGICGSCAMRINKKNRLACQTLVKELPKVITIEPLPGLPVIKDLVVDMDPFFEKIAEVMPYLINRDPPPERERLQRPEDQEKILEAITCILCGCCTTSCPVYQQSKDYIGPSALLRAYRFIFDTRDQAGKERLERITSKIGLFHCHSALKCLNACPKGIDLPAHIFKLKKLALKTAIRRKD